jgi:hypothetical protein
MKNINNGCTITFLLKKFLGSCDSIHKTFDIIVNDEKKEISFDVKIKSGYADDFFVYLLWFCKNPEEIKEGNKCIVNLQFTDVEWDRLSNMIINAMCNMAFERGISSYSYYA